MACISAVFYDIICRHGRLAERSKAAVLKTVDAKVSGGSNPSPSAIKRTCKGSFLFWKVRFSKSRVPNARPPGCTRLCPWHSLSAIAVRRIPRFSGEDICRKYMKHIRLISSTVYRLIFFIGEIMIVAHKNTQLFGRKNNGAVAESFKII